MELIDIFALFSCVLGGVRFVLWCGICQAQNYLLGVEFLIVGISATNFTTFIATGWQTNYDVAIFLMPFPEVSVCRLLERLA